MMDALSYIPALNKGSSNISFSSQMLLIQVISTKSLLEIESQFFLTYPRDLIVALAVGQLARAANPIKALLVRVSWESFKGLNAVEPTFPAW